MTILLGNFVCLKNYFIPFHIFFLFVYHGYHFVYLVLFQLIFHGIFVKKKKTLPEDKKGYFWKLAQIALKDVSIDFDYSSLFPIYYML